MKFPIVRWAAKPRTRPITAEEARMPDGDAREPAGSRAAPRATPTKTIVPEDRLAEDPVARDRPRRELVPREPPVDELRDDERERRSRPTATPSRTQNSWVTGASRGGAVSLEGSERAVDHGARAES